MEAQELKIYFSNSVDFKIKRFFDISLSLILLPVILSLIIVISLLIKIFSKGPVIFTQYRVGKEGRLFKIYKFRTMHVNAEKNLIEILNNNSNMHQEWQKKRKLKNDPRITKIGRFLRKTSLDELPQIINVFKGEMSLVGPRPYLISELENLKDCAPIILSAMPGITGLWQVSGRSDTTFEERIKLDCLYVKKWSIWLDITILFKTVKVVFKGQGAY